MHLTKFNVIKTQKNRNRGELSQLDKEHLGKKTTIKIKINSERLNILFSS